MTRFRPRFPLPTGDPKDAHKSTCFAALLRAYAGRLGGLYGLALVLLLLGGRPALAESTKLGDTNAILVVASTQAEADRMSEVMRRTRDHFEFTAEQTRIIYVGADELKPKDYKVLGFSRSALPCIAVIELSEFGNPRRILGGALLRNVDDPGYAAGRIMYLWAKENNLRVPFALRRYGSMDLILALGDSQYEADLLAEKIRKKREYYGYSFEDAPILAMEVSKLRAEECYELGFSPSRMPTPMAAVCRFSKGRVGELVGGRQGRVVEKDSDFTANYILYRWARYQRLSIPATLRSAAVPPKTPPPPPPPPSRPPPPPPPPPTAPRLAEFENIWVEHNQHVDGQKGMKIHCRFSIVRHKDRDCQVNAYVYYDDGSKLKDGDNRYNTNDGQVSVGRDIRPRYESTHYKDLQLFLPYDQLHLGRGKFNLKFRVGIYSESRKEFLTRSNFINFTYTR